MNPNLSYGQGIPRKDGILPVLQQAVLYYGATPALNDALDHVRTKLPAAMSWLHRPPRSSS